MNLRTLAFTALLVGAGLLAGGALDDVAPVTVIEPASACANPQKGCGSCWIDPGNLENGIPPHLECHS